MPYSDNYLLRNKGTDSTIEAAYLADQDKELNDWISKIMEQIRQLQAEVDGTEDQEYKDGLMARVSELEAAIEDLKQKTKNSISYDTSANWAAKGNEVSKKGATYIYSDAKTFGGATLPRFKVGDGTTLIKDLKFTDEDIVEDLNSLVRITNEDKTNWNNKLVCYIDPNDSKNLILATSLPD